MVTRALAIALLLSACSAAHVSPPAVKRHDMRELFPDEVAAALSAIPGASSCKTPLDVQTLSLPRFDHACGTIDGRDRHDEHYTVVGCFHSEPRPIVTIASYTTNEPAVATHESFHFALWCANGDADGGHDQALIWGPGQLVERTIVKLGVEGDVL